MDNGGARLHGVQLLVTLLDQEKRSLEQLSVIVDHFVVPLSGRLDVLGREDQFHVFSNASQLRDAQGALLKRLQSCIDRYHQIVQPTLQHAGQRSMMIPSSGSSKALTGYPSGDNPMEGTEGGATQATSSPLPNGNSAEGLLMKECLEEVFLDKSGIMAAFTAEHMMYSGSYSRSIAPFLRKMLSTREASTSGGGARFIGWIRKAVDDSGATLETLLPEHDPLSTTGHSAADRSPLETLMVALGVPLPSLLRYVHTARCLLELPQCLDTKLSLISKTRRGDLRDFVSATSQRLFEESSIALDWISVDEAEKVIRRMTGFDVPNRERAMYHMGTVTKKFRRGRHNRTLFLFSDLLCYAEEEDNQKLRVRGIIPLDTRPAPVVTDVSDCYFQQLQNCFELLASNGTKYVFFANSAEEKQLWIQCIRKRTSHVQGRLGAPIEDSTFTQRLVRRCGPTSRLGLQRAFDGPATGFNAQRSLVATSSVGDLETDRDDLATSGLPPSSGSLKQPTTTQPVCGHVRTGSSISFADLSDNQQSQPGKALSRKGSFAGPVQPEDIFGATAQSSIAFGSRQHSSDDEGELDEEGPLHLPGLGSPRPLVGQPSVTTGPVPTLTSGGSPVPTPTPQPRDMEELFNSISATASLAAVKSGSTPTAIGATPNSVAPIPSVTPVEAGHSPLRDNFSVGSVPPPLNLSQSLTSSHLSRAGDFATTPTVGSGVRLISSVALPPLSANSHIDPMTQHPAPRTTTQGGPLGTSPVSLAGGQTNSGTLAQGTQDSATPSTGAATPLTPQHVAQTASATQFGASPHDAYNGSGVTTNVVPSVEAATIDPHNSKDAQDELDALFVTST